MSVSLSLSTPFPSLVIPGLTPTPPRSKSLQAKRGRAQPRSGLFVAREHTDRQLSRCPQDQTPESPYAPPLPPPIPQNEGAMLTDETELDKLGDELLKDVYLAEATTLMNMAARSDQGDLFFLTRGIHQLAKQSTMNEALVTFEGVLRTQPTNLVALHGKVLVFPSSRFLLRPTLPR